MLAALRQVRISHHVYSDIVLAELLDALLALAPSPGLSETPSQASVEFPRGLSMDDAPIRPIDVACAVNDRIREDGPIPMTCDMGDCLFVAMSIEHEAFLASACYATMGFAVPAAFGVQAACRQRPLVLLGDGAFQMTGMELGNCQRYGWDPLVLLLNNGGWGMLQAFDADSGFNRLSDWRYAELSRALGGKGHKVQTRRQLGELLAREWKERGKFSLIEIEIAPSEKSPILERYVRVFEERRKKRTTDA
jgi:indolepyruvate decarboxylase